MPICFHLIWLANSRHKTQPGCGMPLSLFERPDQPDCQYYIKTGICKYGASYKNLRPNERNQAATVGLLWLPLGPRVCLCVLLHAAYGSRMYYESFTVVLQPNEFTSNMIIR